MGEPSAFLSVETKSEKCLLCNCDLFKKEKVQKLTIKGWQKFIDISKSWESVNIPIENEYHNLTLVYEQVKDVVNPFGKVHTKCRTLFSTKRDIYTER